MPQLDLFRDLAIASPIPEVKEAIAPADDLPAWTARTLRDAQKFIMSDFDMDFFCDADVDGNQFLCHHNIFMGEKKEYIGCIYRFAPDLPWMILSRGEENSRVMGMSFHVALAALIEWRELANKKDAEMIESWRIKKPESASAIAP